jgi:2-oxo-4-hydroxy-4-carboxy-5-ureidoimidazoline decarboxylase
MLDSLMEPVSLETLNTADRNAFVATLGQIIEHAPWVAEAVYTARPFADVNALYQSLIDAVQNADEERKLALVKGHPELAGEAMRAGLLTMDSAAEQGSAGLNRLTPAELENFKKLNDAYRSKFGIPFIICVRRHGKDSILHQFARRLRNEPSAELKAALKEIFRIAALRLDQRVFGPDRLNVYGRLSTHVLDTYHGRPAPGVAVGLLEVFADGGAREVARGLTNKDGRTERPLIAGKPIPIAVYELRFAIGDYFALQQVAISEPPFLDNVPVRFAVAEPESDYHVPLLITPWSYTTYRGS